MAKNRIELIESFPIQIDRAKGLPHKRKDIQEINKRKVKYPVTVPRPRRIHRMQRRYGQC
ncbi:MAG: hypothetical protein AB9844_09350 [Clostridiaceae bacterium]